MGKVPSGGTLLAGDKTIVSKEIPALGATVENQVELNLRKDAGVSASIKWIIKPKSKLVIQKIRRLPIDANTEAIWASIKSSNL